MKNVFKQFKYNWKHKAKCKGHRKPTKIPHKNTVYNGKQQNNVNITISHNVHCIMGKNKIVIHNAQFHTFSSSSQCGRFSLIL